MHIRIHRNEELYFLNRTRSFLFFFKFIKLKKFFQLKQSNWNDNLVFLRNHRNINMRNWLWAATKKKKYKPYSFFKFSILRYRRIVNPKHWYNFNHYLLTRFNHLYFTGPCITKVGSCGRSINKSLYLQLSSHWVLKKHFNNFINFKTNAFIDILSLRQLRFIQPVTLSKLNRSYNWHSLTKDGVLYRFIPWWKYKTKLTFKNRKFMATKSGKKPDSRYRSVTLPIKKLYKQRIVKFNDKIIFSRTNNKLIGSLNQKQNSYLTGFSYKQGLPQINQKSNILALKILFNSYNYKTYNWRIVN